MTQTYAMPVLPATDENRLVLLHLEIAQRADQLAQRQDGRRDRAADLQCWLEAEREVLEAHAVCAAS